MTLHSVRLRLTAWYAAVLAVALFAAGAITYAVARKQIERSTDASIASTARSVAAGLVDEAEENGGTLRPRSANELLAEFRDNDRAIVVLNRDGSVFATQARKLDRARLLRQPLRIGNASYIVVVAQSLAAQEETLANLRRAMLITAPLALLVASLGGYLLARKTLEPIDRALAGQRRFMADASHELRSPVAILQGELDVTLSRDDRGAAEYRESLEVMRRSVQRLTRIVRDLFLLARSDAGDVAPQRETLSLDDVIRQTVRAYKTVAGERGVALIAGCDGDLAVSGDEDLLQRMLGNLLENAIRYTPPRGEVHVRCTAAGADARIEVRDGGAGVPKELREQIFERFFRVEPARGAAPDGAGSGAGLGLPIARWIAAAHGGTLRLESSGPEGSVFVATLPLRSSGV